MEKIFVEKERIHKDLEDTLKRISIAKNHEFSNEKCIEFKADLKKAKNFYPEIQTELKESREKGIENVVLFMKKKYKELKEMEERNNKLKKEIHEISIPIINEYDEASLTSLEQEYQRKKESLVKRQNNLRIAFNILFKDIDPSFDKSYIKFDSEAGKKLEKLRVQHEIKKEEL